MNATRKAQKYVELNTAAEVEQYLNSLEGDVIRPGSKVTPLLPAPKDFLALLGIQASAPVLIKLLGEHINLRLPVSRATLFKLPAVLVGKVALNKATLSKLLNFIFSALSRKAPNFRLRIPKTYTGGVADDWDGLLLGLKQANLVGDLSLVMAFIEGRMDVEHELLSVVASPATSITEKYQAYLEALKSNTLVPVDAFKVLDAYFNKQENELSLEQKYLWLCSSKLDFYFSVIACLECGWLRRFAREEPQMLQTRTSWFQEGVISSFIKKLRIEKQEITIETPFEEYLNWLAGNIGTSTSNNCISDAKLASFIPLENEADTSEGYTKAEKQKDLLKDWKNSKYPSPQKFVRFVQNLRGGQTLDAVFLADIGFAAIVLDKLFLELFNEMKVYSSPACQMTLEQSVMRYRAYFLHFKATLPDAVAAVA